MSGDDQVEICVVVHDDGAMRQGRCREEYVHAADRSVRAVAPPFCVYGSISGRV